MAMLAWDRSNALWHHYGGNPGVVPCHAVYLIAFDIHPDFTDADARVMVAWSAADHHVRQRDLQGASPNPTWMMEVADTLAGGLKLLASTMKIGPEPFVYAQPTAEQVEVAHRVTFRARSMLMTGECTDRDILTIPLNPEDTQHYVV